MQAMLTCLAPDPMTVIYVGVSFRGPGIKEIVRWLALHRLVVLVDEFYSR